MKRTWILVACVLACSSARAATLNSASCNDADVQAQVTAAADGDTVTIPAGTCTWNTGVSFSDKNVAIIGAGPTSTVVTNNGVGFGISWTQAGKAKWRVSGIGFQNTGAATTNRTFNLDGSNVNASSYGWRIDHVTMSYPVSGGQDVILVYGPTWGLMDHISITKQEGTFILIADFTTDDYNSAHEGQYSLSLPTHLGSLDAIYIEDSSFTCGGTNCAFLDSSSGGQRSVFRHNTGAGGFLYAHWTRSNEIDGHTYEWYANTMDGGAYGAADGYPMRVEAGTGVIFDNTFTSYGAATIVVDERRGAGAETSMPLLACDGSHPWDGDYGDTGAPGWPCLGQIGRGTGNTTGNLGAQPSVPLLAWSNGTQATCATGGACTNSFTIAVSSSGGPRADSAYVSSTPHTSMGAGKPGYGDVDYCVGSTMPASCGTYTNTYVPLPYPHPLQGAEPQAPDGGTIADGGATSDAAAGASDLGPTRDDLGHGGQPSSSKGCGCTIGDASPVGPLPWFIVAGGLLGLGVRSRARRRRDRAAVRLGGMDDVDALDPFAL